MPRRSPLWLSGGLLGLLLWSAPAWALPEGPTDAPSTSAPPTLNPASSPSGPSSSPPNPTLAPAAQSDAQNTLEARLKFQEELLQKQARLLEKQNRQIDELRSQVEELRQHLALPPAPPLPAETAPETEAPVLAEETPPPEAAPETQTPTLAEETPSPETAPDLEEPLLAEEGEDPGPEPPEASEAPTSVSAQASGQQPALNPNISLVLLGGAQLGGSSPQDPNKNKFYLQEAELQISAPVDPNTRLEAALAAHQNEGVELEEAFIQYLGLGQGLELRAGKMFNNIGALNTLHTHALPQIDRPLPYSEFLGSEGLSTPGVELSYLFPWEWYSKMIVSVSSRAGVHSRGQEGEESFALFPEEGKHNPLLSLRWENMADLNEDTTLTLGLSHASSAIDSDHLESAALYGADLTLKWNPVDDPYKELVWRTEYLHAQQKGALHQEEGGQAHLHPDSDLSGWYTYLSYRLNRHFRLGMRYDQADSPLVSGGRTQRGSAYLEYIANEWNALRLQYNRTSPSWQPSYNELLLQWNVVIGPHGAHAY